MKLNLEGPIELWEAIFLIGGGTIFIEIIIICALFIYFG